MTSTYIPGVFLKKKYKNYSIYHAKVVWEEKGTVYSTIDYDWNYYRKEDALHRANIIIRNIKKGEYELT